MDISIEASKSINEELLDEQLREAFGGEVSGVSVVYRRDGSPERVIVHASEESDRRAIQRVIESHVSTERTERQAAEAGREQRRAGLRGKTIKQLSAAERDELLLLVAERLGLADADGVIA